MKYLGSGLLYLIIFVSSYELFRLAEKANNKGTKKILILFAILIPCIFAGLRSDEVGVDVTVYIVPNMSNAVHFSSYLELCKSFGGTEYFYYFLVYLCSRFTSDAGLLLFMIQLCTISPIVVAAYKMKDDLSPSFTMLVYFFCFYNNSLNMMRQSVCIAFVLLGGVYLLQNNCKPNLQTIICYGIALISHNSAIIGILINIVILVVCNSNTLKRTKYIIYAAIIAIPSLLFNAFDLLNSLGIISGKYATYADIFLYQRYEKDWFVNPFSIRIMTDVVFRVALIAFSCRLIYLRENNAYGLPLYVIKIKKGKNYDEIKKISSVQALSLCGIGIYLVILYSMKTVYGQRISLFLDIWEVILIPYVVNYSTHNKRTYKSIFILIMFTYWLLWVMVGGWSGSNIYTFRI